ncbi:MAG: CocE/NonD family hydrolase [Acidimicrobiales bacterium]|nr:CocE/NonD family hydrolase [Acidimicrobiales bacterium]
MRGVLVVGTVVAALVAGCSSGGSDGADPAPDALEAGTVEIDAHGGVGQVWLVAEPDLDVVLLDAAGEPVTTEVIDDEGVVHEREERTTDGNGALMIRYVEPGDFLVRRADDPEITSEVVTVTTIDDHPDPEFYESQEIGEGFGYLTARDGTQLSINVTLPGPIDEGPYPTVIEYSGYDPSNPNPSPVTISKTIAGNQGFATVGVNMRGSGCSGGAFQLWEDPHATDGYDVVETIAAQPWVKGHQVGMVGISYPATAMLYAASTQPPSLAAIAPMASYDDGFRALLWPGGIQNKGFAREWVEGRYEDSDPDNVEWVSEIIDGGDETCADNMVLRDQLLDLPTLIDQLPYFPEINDLGERFAPESFVDQINVPTFMVSAWQDEQVGGHAPTMIDDLTGMDDLYVTLTNGLHAEGLANPSVLQRWLEFLQLYVAEEVPDTSSLHAFGQVVAGEVIRDPAAAAEVPAPEERFADDPTYEEALDRYREDRGVRVLFDNGDGEGVQPGVAAAGFEASFDAYPPAEMEPTTWYLGADGSLVPEEPTSDDAADEYTSDPTLRPEGVLVEDEDPWERLPTYDWAPAVDGASLAYASEPLAEDTVMVGSASADLWIQSSADDADLQVTLTEIRPDGSETYVQSGWLRASKRALDEERSTETQPLITQLEGDAAPLPDGEFELVRLEVYPFAHAFREGSRVRIVISAPGGDRARWFFDTPTEPTDITVARSAAHPSAIVLPVVPGVEVPTDLPPCPSLRGQPCRPYVAPGS